jgi:hypothetical protein
MPSKKCVNYPSSGFESKQFVGLVSLARLSIALGRQAADPPWRSNSERKTPAKSRLSRENTSSKAIQAAHAIANSGSALQKRLLKKV